VDVSEWKDMIEMERQEKDEFFKLHLQSPIPFEDRSDFEGLSYYPPDVNYRFEVPLHEHADKEIVEVQDTGGNVQHLIRWGEFRFTIADTECKLQAYRSEPREERLFIPFRDATSGKETYGAGRYLDLESEEHLTSEGNWILDFNKAYNPWCAYSENYVCSFVPPENWLKVPVRAGEKRYPLKKE